MYEAFFQFRRRPFAAAGDPERYFAGSVTETARKNLQRIVARCEGVGLVIGRTGTGKTLLCQLLAEDFSEHLTTVLLSSGRLGTRRALLQAILYEMRLPYRGMEEGELRLSLIDHLSPERGGAPGLLLLVDEAHTLPWRLLEELRMITNLVRDGQPRVRLILAGSSLLEERFASPRLDSFSQRVAARCYLEPLNREETEAFVRFHVAEAGGNAETIFEPEAYLSIYRATDGIPRLINQVCDHALMLAAVAECRPLTSAVIEEAWSDLQQLPSPWQAAPVATTESSSAVEFVSLDDLTDEISEPISFRITPSERPLAARAVFDSGEEDEEQFSSDLEEDFQPVGSIGPAVELTFAPAGHPFGEAYAEEEVVIDRYASFGADLFAQSPLVTSREGSELSELLSAWASPASEPQLAVAHGQEKPEPKSTRIVASATSAPKLRPAAKSAPSTSGSEVRQPAPKERSPESPSPSPAPVRWSEVAASAQPTIVPTNEPKPAIDMGDSDADLIVIEEEAGEPITLAPRPPLVRRQEYRQLFAKLRRVN